MNVASEEDMIIFGKELYKKALKKWSGFMADKTRFKNVSDDEVAESIWDHDVFDGLYKAAHENYELKIAAIRFENKFKTNFKNDLLMYSHEYSTEDKLQFQFNLDL